VPKFGDVPTLSILHTNDMHGTLDAPRLKILTEWRSQCDLYFDTGDAIKTGNLGIPLRQEPAWDMLGQLRCDAAVLGNRETHPLASAFEAKLAGVKHPLLCANLRKKDGTRPLPGHLILQSHGVKVGIVAVMVPMVTERMKTQLASAYLWDPAVETALKEAETLAPQVDLLFALTHIGYRQDLELAKTGAFAVIFGGHSHTVLQEPELVEKTWIAQGGSHSRFAGLYQWDIEREILTGTLHELKRNPGTGGYTHRG
jgi:2',3'-cyclic-nucleotide 2'-phosphodiesterase (5'-nucleotidase family)